VPMKVLQVHSTFPTYTGLKSVMFQPPDPRFYFDMNKNEYEHITGDKMLVLEPDTNNTVSLGGILTQRYLRFFMSTEPSFYENVCHNGLKTKFR